MAYHVLHRRWPKPRPIWISMIFELLGLIPVLVLFGIAQPDLYRTKMWQVGYDLKLNSDPRMILYAYANHRPLPQVPFVWSQMLTNFNVAISVVTLFILLVKMIMYIMHVWWPLFGLLVNIGMTAIWAVSVYGQMGPDFADARYPSPVAWYIAKSCDLAAPWNLAKSCNLAKGTFAASVYMLAVYAVNLGLAAWAMWPREGAEYRDEDEDEEGAASSRKEKELEMQSMRIPMTPGRQGLQQVPYTPRTMAFHTLDRKLPLRHS